MMTYRFETDESQHLHVVWGWARGFVQYRDLCDNHMPLFHLLMAPIYGVIGDRPTILYWMRFVVLPLYFVTMWATYQIGSLLFSRRTGLWSVIVVGFYPGYQLDSFEFRTDNLWAALWLLVVVVLLRGPFTVASALKAGLLMGLCFGVSLKSALLLGSLVLGGCVIFLLPRRTTAAVSWSQIRRFAAAFVGAAVLVPGIIMAAFAFAGVWPQFRYWVFDHNVLPGLTNHPAWWRYVFPITFPVLVWATAYYVRRTSDRAAALRRGFVAVTFGCYTLILWSYWSLVTRQDYLPFHPVAFNFYTFVLLALTDRITAGVSAARSFLLSVPLPAIAASGELAASIALYPFWHNTAHVETDLLRAISKLTEPSDFILDEKGETVFRQRCFGPVWEVVTVERIRRGLMIDNAAQRCVETHTCVVTKGKDMTPAARRFIENNYIPIGSGLYVAGSYLTSCSGPSKQFVFDIAIPAPYSIISGSSAVAGTLDAQPYAGPRFLTVGRHVFVEASDQPKLAVIWAKAAERGFSPFR